MGSRHPPVTLGDSGVELVARRLHAVAALEAPGSRTISRMRLPISVPPGSRVSAAPRSAASRAACVDFPDASPPSNTIRRPLLTGVHLMAAERPLGKQAGADDDHAAEPEGDADNRLLA